MPIVSRQRLRQQVGLTRLRDTIVGVTTYSPNLGAGSLAIALSTRYANPAIGSFGRYVGAALRLAEQDYHVASFNTASGAWVSAQLTATTVGSGAAFEIHQKVSGDDKNLAIDGIIARLWNRQEIAITAVPGRLDYSIGSDFKVFDAYYFSNPTGTTSRTPTALPIGWSVVTTGSGRELRLGTDPLLGASMQIVIDAQVRATLGSADAATVSIPDEDWVLHGIAARCYQTLIADAPGKEAGKYTGLANAYAGLFRSGIGKYRARVDTDFRGAFGEVVR